MATPLSDDIRALIAYSNEITKHDDTKLGDCIRTLTQGYNGGSNAQSSPLVMPTGALSHRLASLLAYANEITGENDSTIGDAVKTLCYGYGAAAQPDFYSWIKPAVNNNNGAYIDTGIAVPSEVGTLVTIDYRFDNENRDSNKLFGTSLSEGNQSEGCIITYSSTTVRFYHKSGTYMGNMNTSLIPHEIISSYKINSDDTPTIEVDGVITTWNPFGGIDVIGKGNYIIFGCYVKSWNRVGTNQSKCYGCKIFINEELVFDGIPAVDSGGPGLYDSVTKSMRYNASSNGSFELGND